MEKCIYTPPSDNIQTRIDQLLSRFASLEQWQDRYQYLIDLGKKMPPFDPSWQLEENLIHGCQSRVWLKVDEQQGRFYLRAHSEASIVAGLIAILLWVFDGRTKEEILHTPLTFLGQLGLIQHLSPSRANGLYNMIKHLHQRVKQSP